MILLRLFIEFFKIGLFAIGGGMATIPFLRQLSLSTGWFPPQLITDMIAISESTPGPMGINMATYVGFTSFGLLGALIGPLALVFPSVVIIILISKILNKFKESQLVQEVFYGLRPASTGLIIAAGLGVAKIALLHLDQYEITQNIADLLNYKAIILAVVIYLILRKKDFHPILMVIASAVIGIIFKF